MNTIWTYPDNHHRNFNISWHPSPQIEHILSLSIDKTNFGSGDTLKLIIIDIRLRLFQIEGGACGLVVTANAVMFLTIMGFFIAFDSEDVEYSVW